MPISNEDELVEKLKAKENYIEIEGDLAAKVIKIKVVGPVAWGVVLGSVAVGAGAVYMALTPSPDPVTKGFMPVAGAGATGTVATILGIGGAASVAKMVKSAGSISILNDLRSYKVVSKSEGKVVLSRE
ncbi:hypothetical protein [Tolumonas lignilytica]|uniref:hypothetical protein n=1 Tax=Tolumonas lignilytica TaxID=1283284 RepID=UPI000464E229|nr:hypothetical protein [Tolumonas lignilytica]